ncbi:signal peptidase II [Mycetocola reblochoni]|uniref:signal peptidase II n=1 Tax=Mycetocola reblochoni TaxID=331618 RepID=UPI003F9C5139
MTEASQRRAGRVALALLGVVAVVAYLVDQLTKQAVVTSMTEGERIPVLGEALVLHFVRNPGAAFSMASGSTWIFSILASAVVVFIIVFARRIASPAWAVVFGLLLGGVQGNLTDRLVREPSFGLGHVIDFISTPWMMPAIYNVADICIVSSMILLVLLTLRGVNLDGSRETSRQTASPAAGDDERPGTGTDVSS